MTTSLAYLLHILQPRLGVNEFRINLIKAVLRARLDHIVVEGAPDS